MELYGIVSNCQVLALWPQLTNSALRGSPDSVANFLGLAALIGPLLKTVLKGIITVPCENLRRLSRLVQHASADGAGSPNVDRYLVRGLEMLAFIEIDFTGRRPVSSANSPANSGQLADLHHSRGASYKPGQPPQTG